MPSSLLAVSSRSRDEVGVVMLSAQGSDVGWCMTASRLRTFSVRRRYLRPACLAASTTDQYFRERLSYSEHLIVPDGRFTGMTLFTFQIQSRVGSDPHHGLCISNWPAVPLSGPFRTMRFHLYGKLPGCYGKCCRYPM